LKRLKPFSYFEPATVREAAELLAQPKGGLIPLAGGTDLFVRMKRGEIRPSGLVNLKRIPGLNKIEGGARKGLKIGALATIGALENSPLIRASHPVLAEAAGVLGSPSVRNLGTLGGNIGRASPASDMSPSLIVLKARVSLKSAKGTREVPLEDFFKGPGSTAMKKGELITSIQVPPMSPGSGAAYLKIGRRAGVDLALVGVAGLLVLSGKGRDVKEAGLAIASCAPVPKRVKKAEEVLLSGSLTEARLKEAARVAAEGVSPIDDIRASAWYRKDLVEVLAYRALQKALQLAEGGKK
jgi:CO/xanthine dehydrogenase FAD-binding subunit